MQRFIKVLCLLLSILLLMPAFSLATEEVTSEAEPPAESQITPSEESSSEESSSESTNESESAKPEEKPSDEPPASDELTGESEGNTSEDPEDEMEKPENDEETDEDAADSEEEKEESKNNSSSKKSSGVSYAKVRTSAIYEDTKVTVEELGTIYTRIKHNGEIYDVLTAELVFPDLEGQPLRLAYLVAPKTGRASLRDKPAKSETIIRYGDAGDLAIILEDGEDYTRILYRGTICYAVTTTLQPIEIPEENGEYAKLSYEERTDGGTTINIRNQPDRNSCKIAEWLTGTDVTVWSYTDGWYEIEANGMRGFAMEQFVTIDPGV